MTSFTCIKLLRTPLDYFSDTYSHL